MNSSSRGAARSPRSPQSLRPRRPQRRAIRLRLPSSRRPIASSLGASPSVQRSRREAAQRAATSLRQRQRLAEPPNDMPGIGFFFGFDNTPTQLFGDIYSGPSGGSPPTGPNLSPPPGPNNQASLAARLAVFRQEAMRNSIQRTVHAGATGGYASPSVAGPGATGAWPRAK